MTPDANSPFDESFSLEVPLPLDGFRVLDLTHFLAGPYATMVLADLGADVIKLEQPGTGDDSRLSGPFVNGESYFFAQVNRGKRSVVLDVMQPRGRELAQRLAAGSDLVIESFPPGVADRIGLGYSEVSRERPDILYCSISGFGQTGPYRDMPSSDIVAQGVTGVMRMTGEQAGRPVAAGFAAGDIAAGVTAVNAILAAQILRERTGEGQYIDISLADSLLAWTVSEAGLWFGAGAMAQPAGSRHPLSAPYQAYRTADGYMTIAADSEHLWQAAARALGRPDWLTDPRFADNAARIAHVCELEAEIELVTITRTTAEWLSVLDEAGVPAGPVLTYGEAMADPNVAARGMVEEMEHPVMGKIKTLGQPAKFSQILTGSSRPAPVLGQHTREVLAELGLDDCEINELEKH